MKIFSIAHVCITLAFSINESVIDLKYDASLSHIVSAGGKQTQEEEEFRKFLKRKGKKDHVTVGLIKRCIIFEEFLHERRKLGMDLASTEDIKAFAESIKGQRADVGNCLRAISLYYRFKLKPELSAVASGLREQRLAPARKPCSLKNFRGAKPEYVSKLASVGIRNSEQILALGKTRADRQRLSQKTRIPEEAIWEFVKLADLSRIEGVKSIRARLYYDAGIDTVEKMATWKPEDLRAHVAQFVKESGFQGIAPLPKEAKHTVEVARKLPRIIES